MTRVTRIVSAVEQGDHAAAARLLPLVYDELRRLAAQKLAEERPGQTLQPTALVHEAYLRVTRNGEEKNWEGREHLFAAIAEAMRRILIESARRKARIKRGGGLNRVGIESADAAVSPAPEGLLAIDDALDKLADDDPRGAELIRLRFFVGLSLEEAASVLGVSRATAYRHWAYARAWLRCELRGDGPPSARR